MGQFKVTCFAHSSKLTAYIYFLVLYVLIESKHIPLFASWIDKKESSHYKSRKLPYDFKLLYRANRDGFNNQSFHRNCDNKGATIFVAKIQGSTQLIGGYNSLDWMGIVLERIFSSQHK